MAPSPITRVAVLGAGVMGAQIAAHFANAGIPSLLLDLNADTARDGLKRAMSLKPSPFFTREAAALIAIGGFDRDLATLVDADWIIEAIVERIDAKRALLEQVDAVRRPGSIVSSNTSGIPIAALAEGRSADFRRHWLGTHFFNPPRYLRLLELIPTADTDPAVVTAVSSFADHRLGKGIVVARDMPGFIANHLGLFGVAQTIRGARVRRLYDRGDRRDHGTRDRPAQERDIPHDGHRRHRRARARNARSVGAAERRIGTPGVRASTARTRARRTRLDRGESETGFLQARGRPDPHARPGLAVVSAAKQSPRLPSLDAAMSIEDVGQRIKALFLGQDKVGTFLRATLGPLLVYTAGIAPAIAYSRDDIDRAMRWGFGWELGPFEMWDAIGVGAVMSAAGSHAATPPLVSEVLASGRDRFRDEPLPPAGPGLQILRASKARGGVVRRNAGASLVDLGDGVLAVEFHSKMNTIGADTVQMLQAGLSEAAANFTALVIGNDAPDFSVGANLMLVLLEAQEGNWDEIDLMVRGFQQVTQAIRYAPVPVVVATAGMTLGGGCEMALHAHRVQAAAETYLGLVEVGVGLIPGGGGTLAMLARAVERAPNAKADLMPFVQPVFETIAFGKVSTSAAEARQLGYLRGFDGVTMNRERLMADAKALALDRAREGYQPPARRTAIPVGGEGLLAPLKLGVHLAWRAGRISDYDALLGRTLARVLAGGTLPQQSTVDEQYLLDLEREAFLQLCGERKTLERIQHTLKTGKTLRN